MKDKNQMISSIDTGKAFDKIQHPFMVKNNQQFRNRRKLPTNIILNSKRLNAFPLRSGKRQECPVSPLLFNIVLEVLWRYWKP